MSHTDSKGVVASQIQTDNIYLQGSLGALFLKTAAPIMLVMVVNGLFTIVDAYFLGVYVGADAVIAVTLMFPLYMMIVALSTLVGNGFSSVYARYLGANEQQAATDVFASALQLSVLISGILIVGFVVFGWSLALQVAAGDAGLATLGHLYIAIMIFGAPLTFVYAVNLDAVRAEGLLPFMAAVTMASALMNIFFDWLFIVPFDMGVAGSAYGTLLSQLLAAGVILLYRRRNPRAVPLHLLPAQARYWVEMLALGAPSSLGYVGLSLSAGVTLFSLQIWAADMFETTSGAFGILTRLMTFTFLPLLGLSLAFQTIVGNNYGAGAMDRVGQAVRIALVAAFIYCATMQGLFLLLAPSLGGIFVDDTGIQLELARIIPVATLTLILFGPLMMIATYFQAIGDAARAAILGLSRTYVFAIPLTFALPFVMGEWGIWYAGAVAEGLVLATCILVLWQLRLRINGS
ncbi:MATE family efflux transporter [Ascidiaceihabitans sp.]|uniref:MATE family efflux transporter n=1 Tax=Ascidiaceihabitans sp. TaxID=1872644 RepID=UPI003297A048